MGISTKNKKKLAEAKRLYVSLVKNIKALDKSEKELKKITKHS